MLIFSAFVSLDGELFFNVRMSIFNGATFVRGIPWLYLSRRPKRINNGSHHEDDERDPEYQAPFVEGGLKNGKDARNYFFIIIKERMLKQCRN